MLRSDIVSGQRAYNLSAEIGIFIIGWLTDRKDPSNPDSPATWLQDCLRKPLAAWSWFSIFSPVRKIPRELSMPSMPQHAYCYFFKGWHRPTFNCERASSYEICEQSFEQLAYGQAWLYMILVSVTLAVAAIPEGIPLCVTISLWLSLDLELFGSYRSTRVFSCHSCPGYGY